jgi:hypothetical protein
VSVSQRDWSASCAQGSRVTQTPPGQSAPTGHSDATVCHSQPATTPHADSLAWPAHASLTNAAGTGRSFDC